MATFRNYVGPICSTVGSGPAAGRARGYMCTVKLGRSQSKPGNTRVGRRRLSVIDTVENNDHTGLAWNYDKPLQFRNIIHNRDNPNYQLYRVGLLNMRDNAEQWTPKLDQLQQKPHYEASPYYPRCYLCIFIPNTCVAPGRCPGE